MDVLVIVTGGTLDKVHDSLNETLAFPETQNSHFTDLLDEARCSHPRVLTLYLKDSLDVTDADRQVILSALRQADEAHIVITHGTSTMGETARFLARNLDAKTAGKTIVLTGAMRPFSLGGSDASFNVGGAIIGAQSLAPGIYGVMNGRIIKAEDLRKNTELGRFDVPDAPQS